jgi:tetratricopeptide (TPR) repeat protein
VASHTDRQRRLAEGLAHHKRGDFTLAYRSYETLLRDFPADAAAQASLGLLAFQTGHIREAIEWLRKSVAIDGSVATVHGHLGQAYAADRQWGVALRCLQNANAIAPQSAEIINNLANVLRQSGKPEAAVTLYRQAIALEPSAKEAHYNLGKVLREQRVFEEALVSFERAAKLDAANYRANYEWALCLEELGRFDEAVVRYQAALHANPNHARSLANLLALREFPADTAFVNRAIAVLAGEKGSEGAAKLQQGIGKYFDRKGEYSRAFTHFTASNAIQKSWSKAPGAPQGASKHLAAAVAFDRNHFARVKDLGNPSPRPIFIIGMPRSGTTLIEQVLASHPLVFGAGELMEIPRIADALTGLKPPTLSHAAQRYLDHVSRLAPESATRVTDKLPMNYRHLGLISSLFPNARIIHCCRDCRDVLLSCFIETFGVVDEDFASLEGIVRTIVAEARLMAHWRNVLPSPILEVDYNRFVTDQEGETRRLLAFCDLPWDQKCLAFHITARFIDTPSRWQVKQPVYASSRGRWKNYARELQSSIAILKSEGLVATE